jgi:hypothetical protein
MTKATRRSLLFVSVALVVAAAAFVVVRLTAPPKDLRSTLASALHLPKDREQNFFVNLPPAGSRYPGAIMVVPQMLVLEPSTANETGLVEGDHFTLVSSDTVIADALTGFQSSPLTTAGRDKENVDVSLHISDGRVLEMAVPDLKQRLLSSQSAQSAANKGTDPIVITRAYTGILLSSFARSRMLERGSSPMPRSLQSCKPRARLRSTQAEPARANSPFRSSNPWSLRSKQVRRGTSPSTLRPARMMFR